MMNRREERYLDSRERGFLSTVDSRGAPSVVPVCFVRRDGKIYTPIDEKPKSDRGGLARVRNIASHDEVAFVVDTYSENWELLSYLMLHGRASVVSDDAEASMARGLLASKYPQYRWVGLGEAVIAIEVARSKFWSFK